MKQDKADKIIQKAERKAAKAAKQVEAAGKKAEAAKKKQEAQAQKRAAKIAAAATKKAAAKTKKAEAVAKKLEGLMVKISAKAGEGGRLFGAVTTKEISEALSAQHGLNIAKTKIVLEDPIKSCGSYSLKCKLGHEVTGVVNVLVVEG